MPELPEVETIANGLHQRVAGDRIESVWLGSKPEPLKPKASEIARTLEGARVERVRRVGENNVFDLLSNGSGAGRLWIVHVGMPGGLRGAGAETEIPNHPPLVARLESGRGLRFVDPRRFGRWEVRDAGFEGPGAEPLEIAADDFASLFHRRIA